MTADAIEQPIGTDPLARLRVSKRRHEVAERSIKARRVKQLDDLDQLMPHLPVEIDPDEKAKGVAHGTRWGRDEASYSVLLDLSAINIDGNNFDPLVEIAAAAGLEIPEEAWEDIFLVSSSDKADHPSRAYMLGFIEGAQNYFDSVRDQLACWPWGTEDTAGVMAGAIVMLAGNPMSAEQFLAASQDIEFFPCEFEGVPMLDRVIKKLTAIRSGWK
jgi:hypothetical protein